MTVHFISVGVSLLESLGAPRQRRSLQKHDLVQPIQDLKPHRLLADLRITSGDDASAWLASALAPEADSSGSSPLSALCAEVHPELWESGLSAELDTFARASGAGPSLSAADTAVLICSDTADGLVAGLWNAVALTKGDPGRVRYLASPEESPNEVRGKALLVRVSKLAARTDQDFAQAMEGLGHLGNSMRNADGVSPSEPFRFYLSGGFKAAIPYLIGLAEGLRSLDHPDREVSAWVLHDTTKSAPIRLPLRRLIRGTVQEELGVFRGGLHKGRPGGSGVLEGYAYDYDPDHKGWQLTPFGAGLRTLFGLTPEGLHR